MAGVLRIASIGWPVSLQQSFASLALMIAYAIVAQLGSTGAAVINVLLNLTMVTVQTAIGFGVAAATLVGQSLGRGDDPEARAWGWRAVRIGLLLTAPLGLAAAAAPEPLLRLFLHDPATLGQAIWPARLVGVNVVADTVIWVLCYGLRGAGATKLAAGVPFVRLWLIQLPLMWWIGLGFAPGRGWRGGGAGRPVVRRGRRVGAGLGGRVVGPGQRAPTRRSHDAGRRLPDRHPGRRGGGQVDPGAAARRGARPAGDPPRPAGVSAQVGREIRREPWASVWRRSSASAGWSMGPTPRPAN